MADKQLLNCDIFGLHMVINALIALGYHTERHSGFSSHTPGRFSRGPSENCEETKQSSVVRKNGFSLGTLDEFIGDAEECTMQEFFHGSDKLIENLEKHALDLGIWLAKLLVSNQMALIVTNNEMDTTVELLGKADTLWSEAPEIQVPCANGSEKMVEAVFSLFLEHAGDLVKSVQIPQSLFSMPTENSGSECDVASPQTSELTATTTERVVNCTCKDNSDLVRTLIELRPIYRRKRKRFVLWDEMRKLVFAEIGSHLHLAHCLKQMKSHAVGFCSKLTELEAWRISFDKTARGDGRFSISPDIYYTKPLQLVPAGVRLYLSSIWGKKKGADDYSAIYRKPLDLAEIVDLMRKEIDIFCSNINCPLDAYKEKVKNFEQNKDPKPQDIKDLAVACVNAYCCHGAALEGQLMILNILFASKDDLISPILDAITISDKDGKIKNPVEYLGGGKYGIAHKFKDNQGIEHCLKVLPNPGNSASDLWSQREKEILKSLLGVPNVIQLVEKEGLTVKAIRFRPYSYEDELYYEIHVKDFLIMTPVGKPLNHYLNPLLPEKRKDQLKEVVQRDIRSALKSIHKMNIVHRDVRTPNIIVIEDEEGNPKDAYLIDFGLAMVVPNQVEEFQSDLKNLVHVLKCIDEKRAHLEKEETGSSES